MNKHYKLLEKYTELRKRQQDEQELKNRFKEHQKLKILNLYNKRRYE